MFWPLLLTALALGIGYHYIAKPQIRRNGQKIRSAPGTLPILGNAVQFLQSRHVLFDWFVRCQQIFGDETFEIAVPTLPPGVVINSPENLEYVLKNEAVITKGEFFRKRSWDLFGHGIINATGDLWKTQRKAGLKFFSGTNLEAMVEELLPEAYESMKSKLKEVAINGNVVDMQDVFLDFTTAVVGRMAYDMEIDASHPFSKAFDYASDRVGLRFQNPIYPFTEIFTGKRFWAAVREVKKFGRQIVATAKKERSQIVFESLITNDEPVFGSLIDSLLESFRDPAIVADAALNFLSAGRDTTAQSFTWTLYAIMRHPETLKNIRQEVQSQLNATSRADVGGKLSVAALQPNNIPYIMAVFYEALRLYPPVPFELKQCQSDVTLPDGTVLPKNSIVVWCIWSMNRSEKLYGNDVTAFKPERWLAPDGKLSLRTAYEYPVFNGGPRACLGKKMAELMAAFLLVKLATDFDFEEVRSLHDPEASRVSQNSLTLPMKDGLPCMVTSRT